MRANLRVYIILIQVPLGCEDFFLLVVEAHIVSSAIKFFGMESVEAVPGTEFFPAGSAELDSLQRQNVMMLAIHEILKEFVDLSYDVDSV